MDPEDRPTNFLPKKFVFCSMSPPLITFSGKEFLARILVVRFWSFQNLVPILVVSKLSTNSFLWLGIPAYVSFLAIRTSLEKDLRGAWIYTCVQGKEK